MTGLTPMHLAAVANSVECIKLLLEHDARLDLEDKEGDYPLHSATRLKLLFSLFSCFFIERSRTHNQQQCLLD